MELLANSAAVHRRLRALFSSRTKGRRRVILVAYIGADAPALLPDLTGVEIYCWPQVGATNPFAVAELMKPNTGASVYFVDKLHAKLYWVEGKGFVVGSANLTKNALGSGGLNELAVFEQDTSKIDIDHVIAQYTSQRPTVAQLAELQVAHDRYWAAVPDGAKRARAPRIDFKAWAALRKIRPWKMTWWDEEGDEAESSAERARAEGVEEIENFMDCRSGDFQPGDWLLTYRKQRNALGELEWMYVDLVHKLESNELDASEPNLTHQALQLRPWRSPVRPPFVLDGKFKSAFRRAAGTFGTARLLERDDVDVPQGFVDLVLESYD